MLGDDQVGIGYNKLTYIRVTFVIYWGLLLDLTLFATSTSWKLGFGITLLSRYLKALGREGKYRKHENQFHHLIT